MTPSATETPASSTPREERNVDTGCLIPTIRLGIRAAIHTGEIEIAENDIRGVAVHEASRLLGVASESEILVSATTALLVGEAGLILENRGERHLRGLEGARRIFALR